MVIVVALKLNAIIVGDGNSDQVGLQAFLKEKKVGCRIERFGDDILNRIASRAPSLVFVPWSPDAPNKELCEAIRSSDMKVKPFIIAMIKRDGTDQHAVAWESGFDHVLALPPSRVELRKKLDLFHRTLEREEQLQATNEKLDIATSRFQGLHDLLSYTSRRFQDLFERIPVACFTCDLEGIVFEWNYASEKLFGFHAAEVMQRSVFDLIISKEDVDSFRGLFDAVRKGGSVGLVEQKQIRKDGGQLTVLMDMNAVAGRDGETAALLIACNDITDRKVMEDQLEHQILKANEYAVQLEQKQGELESVNGKLAELAKTDGLTGLLNHRSFRVRLGEEVERAIRYKKEFSLIMLDVDSFKSFNDTFGHPAGDAVLRTVARIIQAELRDSDIAARYGGEEFVALLPYTGVRDSLMVAERIRQGIESAGWDKRSITASFGISTLGTEVFTADELVQQADTALYAAKHKGKNCIVHANTSGERLPKAA